MQISIMMMPPTTHPLVSLHYSSYLIFVADATNIVRGDFFVIWRNFRCGDILDGEKFQRWRTFRYTEICDVEIFFWCNFGCFVWIPILLQHLLFCCKTCFVVFYALSMWPKMEPNNFFRGETMTNIMYVIHPFDADQGKKCVRVELKNILAYWFWRVQSDSLLASFLLPAFNISTLY